MKHYLKCNNCDHLNEMKSGYVVLCVSCGKKMDNNFTEWQRRNPGKNFDDYKLSVGITENQIPPETPKKKTLKSRSLKEKILIVIFTVLAAAIGSIIGQKTMQFFQHKKNAKTDISTQQWNKKTYGTNGIVIDTPWELSKMPDPAEMGQYKDYFESFEMFENSDDESVKVVLSIAKYKPEVAFDLQGSANGTISGLKNQSSVSNFLYDEEPYSLDSIPGYKQTGTFDLDGQKVEFTSFGFFIHQIFRSIIISVKKDDPTAQKAAKRITESIELK